MENKVKQISILMNAEMRRNIEIIKRKYNCSQAQAIRLSVGIISAKILKEKLEK